MPVDEFNQVMSKQLRTSQIDWQAYYLQAIDPIKEMHELVVWASEYYEVGLLSNIMPGFITAMMAQGLLPQVPYAAIIDSSVVKAIKPEPLIYQIATEQAQVPAEEILLVDDSRANVMAAEKFGWHVLWFDDYRPQESSAHVKAALEPEA